MNVPHHRQKASRKTSFGCVCVWWGGIHFSGPPQQSLYCTWGAVCFITQSSIIIVNIYISLQHCIDLIKSLSGAPGHCSPGPYAEDPVRARKNPECWCLHRLNYPALLIKTADRSSALSAFKVLTVALM